MSLTNDDLKAIKTIVKDVVEVAIEDSKQHTAAGLAEVHSKITEVDVMLGSKIDEVDNKLSVKDGKLENTVQRVDKHDEQITKINKKLTFAK